MDTGLRPVADSPGETFTSGLDDLQERCEVFFRQGARFAKWRAALRIDVDRGLPSADAIRENADTLAKYAHVAQKCGLVPMVEPEILIDGTHTQAVSAKVARLVISAVYDALKREEVCLEASLLKPMMIMPGLTCPTRGDMTPDSVARATIEVMKDVVPECVPGIMFLSGGMSEIQATSNLNALNLMAREDGGVKWRLSFSYGRALQTSVLEVWKGEDGNRDAAMKVACELGRANGRASDGEFCGIHPSRGGGELYEGFRGWREEEGKANGV